MRAGVVRVSLIWVDSQNNNNAFARYGSSQIYPLLGLVKESLMMRIPKSDQPSWVRAGLGLKCWNDILVYSLTCFPCLYLQVSYRTFDRPRQCHYNDPLGRIARHWRSMASCAGLVGQPRINGVQKIRRLAGCEPIGCEIILMGLKKC